MVAMFELPMTRWTQRFAARRVIKIGYLLLGWLRDECTPGAVGMLFLAMTILQSVKC